MTRFSIIFIICLSLISFLRLYRLDTLPPALYWEEVALGYDAYSILKTGADHHGNSFPLVAFESFGDWKPSLYFYSIVPWIAMFGLSEWSVRLPAAISGILTVIAIALLARFIFTTTATKLNTSKTSLWLVTICATLISGISPWGVLFSRAGWEVMLATALVTWGVYLGFYSLKGTSHERLALTGSVLLLVLSMYAYHATRVIAPLLGLSLFLLHLPRIWSTLKLKKLTSYTTTWILLALFAVGATLPFLQSSSVVSQRFAETTIFSDISIIEKSNQAKAIADNSLLASIYYHRYILFGQEILQNFFAHFRLDFLFLSGDENPRHSIQYLGQLYHIELLSLLLGFVFLITYRNRYTWFLLIWLLIGIIPSAISKASPHALRTLPTWPVFMILSTFGWYYGFTLIQELLGKRIKVKTTALMYIGVLSMLYLLELSMFWRYYTILYPKAQASAWQDGYKEMIAALRSQEERTPELPVYISRSQGRPLMYYWFYTQTDPTQVQKADEVASQDQGEYTSFLNKTAITSLEQVTQRPAIVVVPVVTTIPTNHQEVYSSAVWKIVKLD